MQYSILVLAGPDRACVTANSSWKSVSLSQLCFWTNRWWYSAVVSERRQREEVDVPTTWKCTAGPPKHIKPKSPFLVSVSLTVCLACADTCRFGKRSWREWKASCSSRLAGRDILGGRYEDSRPYSGAY